MEVWKTCGLEQWLAEIDKILKGFELPLNHFYKTKNGFSDLEPLVLELESCIPTTVVSEQRDFICHFFKMSIAYLEANCRESDQLFCKLVVLASTVEPGDDGISTFSRMIDHQRDTTRTKTEEKFFDVCKKEFELFSNTFPKDYEAHSFKVIIEQTIENFMHQKKRWLSKEQFDKSQMPCLLDYAKSVFCREYLSVIGEYDEE